MDSTYASEYRNLYQRHWWWRSREAVVLDLLRNLSRGGSEQRILSVGCGDGLMFEELSALGSIEGIEINGAIVSRDNPWRDAIHIAPFDQEFRPAGRYDSILMLDVLEHLPDPAGALRHALSLLDPRGRLVVTVPAFNWLWTSHDDLNEHDTRYTRGSFERLCRGVGRIRQDRYLFHWLAAAKLLVRAKEAVVPTRPQPPRLPPRPLNNLLYHFSRAEQRWLSSLRLPWGSSYLAVVEPAVRTTQREARIESDFAMPVPAFQLALPTLVD